MKNVFWKPILRSSLNFSGIFDALLPSETAKRKWYRCYKQDLFFHFKSRLKCIGMPFLCVIHGPQNYMKWMKIAFRCWNLWFCMILLCFNPVNTTHLFLWKKIASFGCGVMARLWVQTTGFDVCLWQSLNDLLDIFLTLKGINDTWKSDSWWPSTQIVFRKQNNVATSLPEMKMLASQYIKTVWRFSFACKLNCLKQSLIWSHLHSTGMTTEEFLYPTHCLLKVEFWGYVHLRHSYGRIRYGNH